MPFADQAAIADKLALARTRAEAQASSALNWLLNKAIALQIGGRLAEAAQSAEAALQHDPDHPEVLLRLGMIRAQEGKLVLAVEHLQKGLSRGTASPEGYCNLGMALYELQRTEEAIAAYKTAVSIRPAYSIALNNLGAALASLNRFEEAIGQYEAALAIEPDYTEALNNLGAALHAAGQSAEAVKRFRSALAVRPGFVEAEINLGHALIELERIPEAITHYQSALKMRPGNAHVHLTLANALSKAERFNEAILHYEKAHSIEPNLAPAYAGLGMVYLEIGKVTEARSLIQKAISIDPHRPGYFHSLTRVMKMKRDDPNFDAMLALADGMESFNDGDKIDMHFALGKALADLGDNQTAFEHQLAGNLLKRQQVSYDEVAFLKRIDRIRTTFNIQFFQNWQGYGNTSSAPVFIVGMPRSGSTLVEQILASHPAVFGAGELSTFGEAMHAVGLKTRTKPYSNSAHCWSEGYFRALGNDYVTRLTALASQEGRIPIADKITDKMLTNFLYAGLIHLALPNARIIHTSRDPIDTCLSCFSIQFAKLPFTYDLGELGRYYHAYAKLMRHWHETLPCETVLEVRYEELIRDFEPGARRIIAHCGLSWVTLRPRPSC